jgi:O-antigen/teichoic acid export membrane protein
MGYAVAVFVLIPEFRSRPMFDRAIARSVFRFGGWVTVSNVVSPLYGLLDRTLVGRWVSWADVTFYATAAEVVGKTQVISTAFIQVLFPSFTKELNEDRALVNQLVRSAFGGLLCLILPVAVLLMAGAESLLTWWIDADLALRSAGVMQVMVYGMVFNALARVPLIVILAKAKPKWPAIFHLIELLPFLLLAWIGIRQWGIVGAALAWTFRVALDFVLLMWAADRMLGRRVLCRGRHLGWLVVALVGLGWIQIGLVPPWGWLIGFLMVGASACGALVCRHQLATMIGRSTPPQSAAEIL